MKLPALAAGLAAALGLAVGCARPVVRDAAGVRAAAAAHFDEGVAAYARGEYPASAAAFERAYALAPEPEVLFNLARAHDSLGHDARAARYYVAYARADRAASAGRRRDADEALARLQGRVAWLVVRAVGAFEVDGETVPRMYDAAPLAVEPGERVVRAGRRSPVVVRARAGEALGLDFTGEALAVSTPSVAEALVAARGVGAEAPK